MRDWSAERVGAAAGARLLAGPASTGVGTAAGPTRVSIDSRHVLAGDLFVGLRGRHTDGGAHALQALRDGAWGVLVTPEHARPAAAALAASTAGGSREHVILEHADPLAAMQALAHAWRGELRALGAKVVAITGSTGKTSTKDILAALLGLHLRVAASPENLNTEIGLPLALLAAPGDAEAVVLEMAMRGSGQIAELTAIAEPDVGVIVNVGPAHLELLGSLEAIAAAKAELIAGMAPGTSVVVPAGEQLLAAHLRSDLRTITFGEEGDVSLCERRADGAVVIDAGGDQVRLWPSFDQAHNLRNLLAAVAAAGALELRPEGRLEVRFSSMRGQRIELAGNVVLIADCYNANPMSMRAAIDDLAVTAPARRVAVLGDMLELGAHSPTMHREIGEHASAMGVELLIGVGSLAPAIADGFAGEARVVANAQAAAELLPGLLRAGDTVLVKGSRGVGLELVVERMSAPTATTARESVGQPVALTPSGGLERS
ncbi:MAG: UDP-N-acetylmuramoyl-tripeptide--D-alanyl-D-alanine ligase [Solirubrobacteraceae bacterium]